MVKTVRRIRLYRSRNGSFFTRKDDLYQSLIHKKLHRNFMGYTSSNTQLMVGLGMSAISDSWYAFAQNEKSVEEYQKE